MNYREYTPNEKAGAAVEQELLGVVKEAKNIELERKEVFDLQVKEKILEIDAAMMNVKNRQTQGPINPSRPFANFVRTKIADLLDLKNDKSLKFYSAVSAHPDFKTMLDIDFGIDAFFELEKEGKESVIVSIDLTLKELKEKPKASIVFSIPKNFPTQAYFEEGQIKGLTDSEWKTFDKYTDDLAEQVAEKFKKVI